MGGKEWECEWDWEWECDCEWEWEGTEAADDRTEEYKNTNNGETLFSPSLFSQAGFYSFIFYLAVVRKLIMCG